MSITRTKFARAGLLVLLVTAQAAHADDRALLSAKAQAPNIMWLLDSSGSMYNWVCRDAGNCLENSDMYQQTQLFGKVCKSNYFENVRKPATDPTFVFGVDTLKYDSVTYPETGLDDATNLWLTPLRPYPRPDQEFVQNNGTGPEALFPPNAVYTLSDNNPWSQTATSIKNYCSSTNFPNCHQRHRCIYMLRTEGYFMENASCTGSGDPGPDATVSLADVCTSSSGTIKTQSTPRVLGNFLRYEPPKYVTARRVMKDIMLDNSLVRERMGFTVYNNQIGGNLIWPLGPDCAVDPEDENAFITNKSYIRAFINRVTFNSNTPLGESEDDIGCYFADGHGPNTSIAQASTPTFNSKSNTRTCKIQCVNALRTTGTKWPAIENCDAAFAGLTPPLGTPLSPSVTIPSVPNPLPAAPALPAYPVEYLPQTFPYPWPETFCNSCQKSFQVLLTDGLPTVDAESYDFSGAPVSGGTAMRGLSYFMRNNDLNLDMAGVQTVTTYTISFGALDATGTACAGVLQEAAANGGGQCFAARNAAELKDALRSVLVQVQQSSKSFAAPAIQATRTQGENSTNLAVFKTDDEGPLWFGHVYAFKLWDEQTQGEYTKVVAPQNDPAKKNGVFVVDANGDPLSFDPTTGNLVAQPVWDAQLCLSGDFNNSRTNPDVDPWNLNVSSGPKMCKRVAEETATDARRIYTKAAVTVGAGSVVPDGFKVANVTSLMGPMGLTGATNSAIKTIKFFRGFDMLDKSGLGDVSYQAAAVTIGGQVWDRPIDRNLTSMSGKNQWYKLGDIFHSAPSQVSWDYSFMPESWVSFYNSLADSRKRAIIVGANDGMIHAFNGGNPKRGDNPATVGVTEPTGNLFYDDGTGEELWAFVPNHHLPNLKKSIKCIDNATQACTPLSPQNYYVDGSPWVRDIWGGGTTTPATIDNLVDPSKGSLWRTIAVIGDRDGGTQYTALDITDTSVPKFLWEFPQASQFGSGAAQRKESTGASWSDVLPVAPPIVPILWDNDQSGGTTTDRYFRYVVILPGGFSRNQTAGRGFYMIDAMTSEILYKFERTTSPPANQSDLTNMTYSFAAPPTAIPRFISMGGRQVELFTEIVAVDTGGFVWRANLGTNGLLSEYSVKKVFQSATYASAPNSDTLLSRAEYPFRPMFQISNASRDSNQDLWVFVGTGDRDLIANPTNPMTGVVGVTNALGTFYTSLTIDSLVGADIICGNKETQHFYAINLDDLARKHAATPGYPYTISALQNRTAATVTVTVQGDTTTASMSNGVSTGLTSSAGWYLNLMPQEKVDNPAAVGRDGFGGSLVNFTTFQPTTNCTGGSGGTCGVPAGIGRQYTFQGFTGVPVELKAFKDKVSPVLDVRQVKDGSKTAATVTMTASPTANAGGAANIAHNLVDRMFRIELSRSIHEALQKIGSNH